MKHSVCRARALLSAVCATAVGLCLASSAQAAVFAFVGMPMTASQEVPAGGSTGYGSVTALYDDTSKILTYSAVWQLQPDATATLLHFHGPAMVGSSAGVAIGLPTPSGNSGKSTGAVTLSATQEADLLAGKWYLNLHSSKAGGGELRAQLIENSSAQTTPLLGGDLSLTLPAVLTPTLPIPGAKSYGLTLIWNGSGFSLGGATPIR